MNIDSQFGLCPVCGISLAVEELNVHANSHFVSPIHSPSSSPQPEPSSMTCLPTNTQDLVSFQLAEPQFVPGLNILKELEEAYTSKSCSSFDKSVLCVSGPLQHFGGQKDDKGWGCGFRNCQILISHLLLRGGKFYEALFGGVGYVPDISSLQAWLECAWQQGFDPEGKHILEGTVQGTRKWVGAVDIVVLLRQFGINAQFADFFGNNSSHHPKNQSGSVHYHRSCDLCKTAPIVGIMYSSKSIPDFDLCAHCAIQPEATEFGPYSTHGQPEIHVGSKCAECQMMPIVGVRYQNTRNWRTTLCQTCFEKLNPLQQTVYRHRLKSKGGQQGDNGHDKLIEWCWNYFSSGRDIDQSESAPAYQFVQTDRSPLYFQHDGHSRTIIGIERTKKSGNPATTSLIILDPSNAAETLLRRLKSGMDWRGLLKRGLQTLKHAEFQIVYVDGDVVPEEERQSLKRLEPNLSVFA